MKKVNGGSAFPRVPVQWGNGDTVWGDAGMSLRDYFAAKAMAGGITAGKDMPMRGYEGWRDEFALEAYRYADAMLRAREVKE